nr:MAG TPA: hypothetical protein [Caudoviricetes sp.]
MVIPKILHYSPYIKVPYLSYKKNYSMVLL